MDVSNLHFSTISNFLPFIKVCLKLIDRESSWPRKFVTSTHVSCRATFFGYSGTTSRRAGTFHQIMVGRETLSSYLDIIILPLRVQYFQLT